MNDESLLIFANFYIDSEERFDGLKNSFESFRDIEAKFSINIRGRYRFKVKEYLKNFISEQNIHFKDSSKGWFFDSHEITKNINCDYVFIWVEDHICINKKLFKKVLKDIFKSQIDVLTYSWWQNGRLFKAFNKYGLNRENNISWFIQDKHNNLEKIYLIGLQSIIKKSLFQKILINNGSQNRWNKKLPFDFEKKYTDREWLPFKRGILMEEVFASIDDDHGVIGSSLQSRGLYPKNSERTSYASREKNLLKRILNKLIILKQKLLHKSLDDV